MNRAASKSKFLSVYQLKNKPRQRIMKANKTMNRAASKSKFLSVFFPAKPASGGCDRSDRCALATAAKKNRKPCLTRADEGA